MDTSTDTSPTNAQHRCARYATTSFARELDGGAPVSGPGAAWASLLAHQGWTTADTAVTTSADSPDTATSRSRLVTVTITAHSSDGWTSTDLYPAQAVYLTLTPAPGGGWRVSAATTSPQ